MTTKLEEFAEWLDCVAAMRVAEGREPISATKALVLFNDEWTARYVAGLKPHQVDSYLQIHVQAQKTAALIKDRWRKS